MQIRWLTRFDATAAVSPSRWCMEKGSSATLGSFVGLAPEGEVLVQGVNCLGR